MSVNEIDTVVLLIPNEEWTATASDAQLNSVVAQLRPNISFALSLNESLRTLSIHGADASGTIGGFLYVPDLNSDDPCRELSEDYLPSNVTRQANLPPTDFTLVALAPWINAECTEAYLNAADEDPMRGFIFYLPNNGTGQPPPASSSAWDLGDAGSWKKKHGYPVYAVPSNIGQEMIHQSSLYSGNMTSVPHGHQISELPGIDPRDYVRIYTELHISNFSAIPSYPILLLIIVAVLVVMVGFTSAAMHLIWRARRKSLRRRVANGEVNLEALGIKRLTVPQEHISKLPLFTYSLQEESNLPPVTQRPKKHDPSTTTTLDHDDSSEEPTEDRGSRYEDTPLSPVSVIENDVSNPDLSLLHKDLPYSQPTCLICLDDFESGTTPIRELPCGHIFHPYCIDSFLGNNSSLCPMCKKSVLPKGYCPTTVTNAMVRRERNIRRLRSRVMVDDDEGSVESDNARNRIRRYQAYLRGILHSPAPQSYAETVAVPLDYETFMMTSALPATNVSILGNVVPETMDPGLTRRDLAQQQIRELAARPTPDSDAIEARRSWWRKTLLQIFPGFN